MATDGTAQTAVAEETQILDQTWLAPPGFFGWFTHVNHRSIGKRFIITAMAFFVLAGIQALVMRLQLAVPENTLLGPDWYQQFFTMHGTTMMFFFAVPVMEGFGIYLVPLMIGTRDMAFPKLNAFGYYVYLIAGITLYVAFFLGLAPDAGWFNYVPLSNKEFSPGMRIDFWATMITFIEISALVAAVELIITIFKQRAPACRSTACRSSSGPSSSPPS
jgi:cytochrome c oxidase subunit I+III